MYPGDIHIGPGFQPGLYQEAEMAKDEDLKAVDESPRGESPTVPGRHRVKVIVSPGPRALMATIHGERGLLLITWSGPGQGGKSPLAAFVSAYPP